MISNGGSDSRDAGIIDVISAEQETIRTQRNNRNRDPHQSTYTGVAISGGGIRSASFSIGVLQALDEEGYAEKVDYLSTVSGGGYTCTAWTWFNYLNRNGDLQKDGYFFPFGRADQEMNTERFSTKILSFIRRHRSYLVPGHGISYVSAFSLVFRNMLLSSAVYISLTVLLFTLIQLLEGMPILNELSGALPSLPIGHWTTCLLLAVTSFTGFVCWSLLFAPISWFLKAGSVGAYRARTIFQRGSGVFSWLTIIFVILGTIPLVVQEVHHALAGGSASVIGAFGAVWHFIRQQQGKESSLPQSVTINLSSALLILGWAVFAWYLTIRFPDAWLVALPVAAILGWFVNINQYGLGRMYRDRLMETFLPDRAAVEKNIWQPANEATHTRLTEASNGETTGPYHLVNGNLILINDKNKKYRARGGDNFIFSSRYCGSTATGWFPTTEFDDGQMTWPTAMATSGAAINPDAAPDSSGETLNPLVSFLMFALGLRLGIYAGNPMTGGGGTPNLLRPGLRQGLLGQNFSTDSAFLALSDGGHFENTAVYELIRRRTQLIICSEAGQDEDYSFADIANLAEKIRVDFGVELIFMEEFDLPDVMPGSYKGVANPMSERYQFAERGFAIANIKYPEDEQGTSCEGMIVFIKATLTSELTADLYGYRNANPTFPNQSTVNQFFDEPQFEAYRELGYQLTQRLTNNKTFKGWWQKGDNP